MRNELIPKVLKEYRKRNHYSVKDVSIRLMEHDIDVAPKTIYGWESGQAQPTADTLLLLCEIYKIPDIPELFGYDQPDRSGSFPDLSSSVRSSTPTATALSYSMRSTFCSDVIRYLFPVIQSDLCDV